MTHPQLETMVAVGAVTASSARLWARSDRSGAHRIALADGGQLSFHDVMVAEGANDHTGAWTIDGLAPDTEYHFAIARKGASLGAGRFRTAPASRVAPHSFSFAALSCHQPFDAAAQMRHDAVAMLRATHTAFAERDVRFVLMMGDQVYVDHPAAVSVFADPGLLGRSRAEIRARYQEVYRRAWAMPELAALYASAPSWPMLDDHEVVNNFGSLEEHARTEWAALRDGALDAYFDYQGSRVLDSRPPTFDHGFRWGPAAIYQLDIRSARYAIPGLTQVVTDAQLLAFRAFLHAHRDARLLVLMVSVPIAYVPTWFSALAARYTAAHEGADRWSFVNSVPDRDRVLTALLEHAAAVPGQTIVLASGDIHVGTAFELRWDHGPVFRQLTASAITNDVGTMNGVIYELVAGIERTIECGAQRAKVTRIAGGDGEPGANPYSGLNAGIVHVDDDGAHARVRFELVGVGADGRPQTVFQSAWLG